MRPLSNLLLLSSGVFISRLLHARSPQQTLPTLRAPMIVPTELLPRWAQHYVELTVEIGSCGKCGAGLEICSCARRFVNQ